MRIQRLEICGFKSFADRAVIRFCDGITGVVGPNGCGKSNIVDAIRWCMGEMSAKHLRGRAMQDVIFAGCDSRGPLGMAEVTLTFLNDGNVPPQYASFTEIAVTRRLHRDGSSEYLVNKVPARLRDITDLFLGTGVGTRAYSIIEQGRIGFIVSARPEDRRSIIEEVAGITRFKARKKAAERRMEATEQNLLRVDDIVAELERQLGSLRRQAKKAERYKRLKEELFDLDLHAATLELLRIHGVDKVQRAELKELERRLDDAGAETSAEETAIEAGRMRLLEEESRLQEQQQASSEVDTALAALERDLEHWRRQAAEATARAQQTAGDVQDAKGQVAQARTERRDLEESARELAAHVDAGRGRLQGMQAAVAELQAELGRIDEQVERLRRDGVEHIQGAAQQRSLAANLDRQRTDARGRLGRCSAEREDILRRRVAADARRIELESRKGESARQLDLWRNRLRSFSSQLEGVNAQVNESEARILALKGEIAERGSRLASLTEIARRLEGYSDGVRTLFGAAGDGQSEPRAAVDGIEALVTDVIEARPEYEHAIEAVLGDKLQYLVVESQSAGMQAIEFLKRRSGGRSGFIPRTPRTGAVPSALGSREGIIAPALGLVSFAPEHRGIAEYLLGDVVVVADLPTALDIWAQGGRDHVLVTLDGEVLDPAGTLAGGSDDGSGLLAKRREMRELEELVKELERDLALAKSAHVQLEQAHLQLEVNIQQLGKDIHSAEIECVEIEKDLQSAAAEVERLEERAEVLDLEIAQCSEEIAAIDRDQAAAVLAAGAAEAEQKGIEARIHEVQALRRDRAIDLDGRAQDLTNLKVQLATREEKLGATEAAIKRLTHAEVDLRNRIDRGVGTISDDTNLAAELQSRIEQGQTRAAEMAAKAQELRRLLSEARAAYDAERQRVGVAEQAVRARRRDSEIVKEAVMQAKIELQKLDMARQRLIEQVAERHDADLLRVAGDYHLRPMPGPEQQARREELDRAIKSIGPINLTAIEECAEIETRHSFLVKQRDDLKAALDALRRAIQRINRASRERFREAFEAVNDTFQKVFPRLFRGGEARLVLLDSDDVLEAGVEIVAMPPGKKLQNVGLLSGGEKALTAVALVFSIFLVKPSPFCILDEVDAPLDDVNVGRFNEILREIAKISQFILITHNKLSMAEADILYGITMEEPGLSKVVSVDFEERAEQAA